MALIRGSGALSALDWCWCAEGDGLGAESEPSQVTVCGVARVSSFIGCLGQLGL